MENKALAPKLKDENGKRRKQTGERLVLTSGLW